MFAMAAAVAWAGPSSSAAAAASDDEVQLPLSDGSHRVYSSKELWGLFVRLDPVQQLRCEISFLDHGDHWDDYGFSIKSLQQLSDAVGGARVNETPLFAIAIVLFRSRTIEWGWNHPGRFNRHRILHSPAEEITAKTHADIMHCTSEIYAKAGIKSPFSIGRQLTHTYISSVLAKVTSQSELILHVSVLVQINLQCQSSAVLSLRRVLLPKPTPAPPRFTSQSRPAANHRASTRNNGTNLQHLLEVFPACGHELTSKFLLSWFQCHLLGCHGIAGSVRILLRRVRARAT